MCRHLQARLLALAEPLCLVYLWALTLLFNVRYASQLSAPQHVGWILVVCSAATQALSALLWCVRPHPAMAGLHLGVGVLCLACSVAYMQDAAPRMLLALLLGVNCVMHGGLAAAVGRLHQRPPIQPLPSDLSTMYTLDREGVVDL